MNWQPTSDRVLVSLEVVEEVTDSGIVLTSGAGRDKHRTGTVRAVGPGVNDVKVGDRILCTGFAGRTVEGDELVRILDEAEVIGVVE